MSTRDSRFPTTITSIKPSTVPDEHSIVSSEYNYEATQDNLEKFLENVNNKNIGFDVVEESNLTDYGNRKEVKVVYTEGGLPSIDPVTVEVYLEGEKLIEIPRVERTDLETAVENHLEPPEPDVGTDTTYNHLPYLGNRH